MPAEVLGFEDFELDRSAYQLRHKGRPVRLERIPLDLLFLLAERRGQLVTREEIIDRIWGRSVFLDTNNAINTAVRKIRRALRDDPAAPRFVVTVPAKGYRFVCSDAGAETHAAARRRPKHSPAGAERLRGTRARTGRVARRPGRGDFRAWGFVPDFRCARSRQDPAGGGADDPGGGAGRRYDGADRALYRSGRALSLICRSLKSWRAASIASIAPQAPTGCARCSGRKDRNSRV